MTFAIGTPLLDTCVLAVLSRGDAYGYALTAQVKEVLDISERLQPRLPQPQPPLLRHHRGGPRPPRGEPGPLESLLRGRGLAFEGGSKGWRGVST